LDIRQVEDTVQDNRLPHVPHAGEVRELRLALVCYGGVSLAIYMHGVTKEIHKLVRASEALHHHPEATENPFHADSERVYWDLLKRLQTDDGSNGATTLRPRVRVVVDIISGTSAGGINGICLAKALAHNLSQEGLTRLWLENGDIGLLWRGATWVPLKLWMVWFAASLLLPWTVHPPLQGDAMRQWLLDAFNEMDRSQPPTRNSLMPDNHLLELFVPITDFHGYEREVLLDDPKIVYDRVHRHVLEFRYQHAGQSNASADDFGPAHNHALAFAARTTSSFPGAFPPVSLREFAQQGVVPRVEPAPQAQPKLEPFASLFQAYEVPPYDTYFVDGGVLDNYPFASSIDAIRRRPATSEVDRRLLFIEPDPTSQPAAPAPPPRSRSRFLARFRHQGANDAASLPHGPPPPSWVATLWGALSTIPGREPIIDDLLDLAQRNETVARIRDIIETSFDEIAHRVKAFIEERQPSALACDSFLASVTPEHIRAWRQEIENDALQSAAFNAATYFRLRLRLLLDAYAQLVTRLLDLPPQSSQAGFLLSVLRSWAGADRQDARDAAGTLFERSAQPTALQHEFLRRFDLGYHDRRIRFVIAALSWWYREQGQGAYPSRVELDRAKHRLYHHLAELQQVLQEAWETSDIARGLTALFNQRRVNAATRGQAVQEFVQQYRAQLDTLRDTLGEHLGRALPQLEDHLYGDLVDTCGTWSTKVRGDLLVRYLGFPYWDMLVYPVQALSGVGERDQVEVLRISPFDATQLTPESPEQEGKLKGVSLQHFSAFFRRDYRENDYLWGRLDAAERLIALLLDDPEKPGLSKVDPQACHKAFRAILDTEERSLRTIPGLLRHLRQQVGAE
jgi:patatin-related protein